MPAPGSLPAGTVTRDLGTSTTFEASRGKKGRTAYLPAIQRVHAVQDDRAISRTLRKFFMVIAS